MAEISAVADSLAVQGESLKSAFLDTVGKTDIEKEFIASIQTVTNTPADQLMSLIGDKLIQFGIKLVVALLLFAVGGWLIKLVRKILRNSFTRHNTEKAIVSFTISLVTATLWVIVVVISVGALGIQTTSIAALLAAGGMAIGMALSGTVQNFAGGVMILIFKPFRVGDFIDAQGYSGTVSEVNITSTKLVTTDNKVVILPNGPLQSGTVNNYSQKSLRRVDFLVNVEYGSDSDLVKSVLLGLAAADSRVLSVSDGAPADPFVALSALAASSVDFVFRVWTKSDEYWNLFFDMNEKIYKTLPQNGISFPFTQVSVHMES